MVHYKIIFKDGSEVVVLSDSVNKTDKELIFFNVNISERRKNVVYSCLIDDLSSVKIILKMDVWYARLYDNGKQKNKKEI